ncbi:hypothetical protein P3T65_15000 [Pseudomonas nitroreducens]|uniref:WYL domain-containing protein n=1 Tax=Pseudomonas nitroreducens TaxID=46680 RepID=UPI0023F933FD|nr:WYL domain-containing protein [Pseudomonas nitroreducens]WEW95567.1 hypothetical protein P3T65_15000 [Pseudomonas nitroreducens]
MIDIIVDAIRNRKVLAFTYDGLARVVEPHTLGVSKAGNTVLSCFQTEGGHVRPGHEWDLCKLDKIRDLRATGATFLGTRPLYSRGDSRMIQIIAEL